jgi:aspartyl-tRNA(Asn)/glutamyl-tRNA(Gln) amidotransferase subunit A
MPIGMQLLGRPHDDATALRAGHAFQKATEWHKRAPAL